MNDVVFVVAYSRMSVKLGKQLTIILRIFLWINMDDDMVKLGITWFTFEKIVVLMMRLQTIWEFLMLLKMEMPLIRMKIL